MGGRVGTKCKVLQEDGLGRDGGLWWWRVVRGMLGSQPMGPMGTGLREQGSGSGGPALVGTGASGGL